MKERDIGVYLEDILESIANIEEYCQDISAGEFLQRTQVQDAVVRRLEIIGEAVKNIPPEIRHKYPDIPWKEIAETRDVLIHEYFGVDLDKVWEVMQGDLPALKKEVERIMQELQI